MRLHHFFIDQKISEGKVGGQVVVPDPSLVHQLRHVFRLRASAEAMAISEKAGSEKAGKNDGEKGRVILLDDSGFQYLAHVVSLDKYSAVFHIEKRQEGNVKVATQVTLLQSLVKKDTFEWIAEKATELGVKQIIPVISERSEKKSLNAERCRKIIKEASEQSERTTLPTFSQTETLARAIEAYTLKKPLKPIVFAFDPKGEPFQKTKISAATEIAVFIGPEGGWSDGELDLMRQKGVQIFSLGPQILRAETAAISALSLLLLAQ